MNFVKKIQPRRAFWLAVALVGCSLVGCKSADEFGFDPLKEARNPAQVASVAPVVPANPVNPVNTLRIGDPVMVTFSDLPSDTKIPPIEDSVKEDGTITLSFNKKFTAVGKTVGQLQDEIRKFYVPDYFRNLTVTVKTQDRVFTVGGEVKTPNRYIYTGYTTVMRAIDTAGGFTDFAKKTRIILTRSNGEKIKVNGKEARDHPEKDPEIYPGDRVDVTKRLW
ncbi:MAG TPA: SLBB domain-containing protein [Verrucomicrobiae bacterium]|nr:SLBB domain-containing protein [Verrucomicrobiae bacterium]